MCAHFQMGLQGNRLKGLPSRGSGSSHYMGFPASAYPKPASQAASFRPLRLIKTSCSSLTLIDSILCECFKCWLAGNEAIIMQNAARKPLQIIRDARPSLCIGNEATRGQRASAHTHMHMHTNILDTLASSSITINGNPINLDTDYWQLFSRPARRTALQRNGQMIGQSTRVESSLLGRQRLGTKMAQSCHLSKSSGCLKLSFEIHPCQCQCPSLACPARASLSGLIWLGLNVYAACRKCMFPDRCARF